MAAFLAYLPILEAQDFLKCVYLPWPSTSSRSARDPSVQAAEQEASPRRAKMHGHWSMPVTLVESYGGISRQLAIFGLGSCKGSNS